MLQLDPLVSMLQYRFPALCENDRMACSVVNLAGLTEASRLSAQSENARASQMWSVGYQLLEHAAPPAIQTNACFTIQVIHTGLKLSSLNTEVTGLKRLVPMRRTMGLAIMPTTQRVPLYTNAVNRRH